MMNRIRNIDFGGIVGTIRKIPAFTIDYFRTQPIVAAFTGLALVLLATFFFLLGTLEPTSPGTEVSLDQSLTAAQQRRVQTATIKDEDHRVELLTRRGEQVWSAYPESEGQTNRIIDAMTKGGAKLTVDQQS